MPPPTNPPLGSSYDVFLLSRHETVWPWYSQIAPVLGNVRRETKGRKLKEIAKEVEQGDMPLFYYLSFHPDAKLSPAECELIVKWAKQG